MLGLAPLDPDGRLLIEQLGATIFTNPRSGIGAAFVYARAPSDSPLTVAGIWVARQGEKVTPLTDPAMLELSALDEGQPLVFRLTFSSDPMPPGDYAFGLFTVENGQIDRLIKRLDFAVE